MTPWVSLIALLACRTPEAEPASQSTPHVQRPAPTADTAEGRLPTETTARTGRTGDTAPEPSPYACPDIEGYGSATFQTSLYNPCLLDPSVTLCREPPELDSHQSGERLHRLVRRTDIPLRDELLLFVPPGPGKHNDTLMEWFAFAGYTTINVGWQNDPAQGQDDAASWQELVYGDGAVPQGDITENDALVGRLNTLLAHMVDIQPAESWDRWWTEADGIQWERIVLVGWSDGASAATYLARDHEVAGVIAISGPKYKEWLADPRQTPGCAHRLFFHQGETMFDKTLEWMIDGMDLDSTVVDVDTHAPPYDDAQVLTTSVTDFQAGFCTHHQAMAMTQCMSDELLAPYLHLACTVVDTRPP